jgi:glutamate-1-semialdehyde aminotransferase/spore coat polysaccharide biosynthesis protein SpsF (cytidylyltransferase family)
MERRKSLKKKPNVVAVIQARMGSSRLPDKVLEPILDKPMLQHVVERVRRARTVDKVVVATTDRPADDAVEAFCRAHRIDVFRGSEEDVLDRFYRASSAFGADIVVRITADCPLIDPIVMDKVVIRALAGDHVDYVTNRLRYTYPDGLDVETVSFTALEKAWKEARLPADREHVTSYIRNPERFRMASVENETDLSPRNLRWTVDEPSDLQFVRSVYQRLGGNGNRFGLPEVLALLDREPDLARINAGGVRNEGFYRSLAREEALPARSRSLAQSTALLARARRVIPSCTQTMSKGPTQFVQGVAPVFLARGKGCRVWDVDGNEYIDYPLALGPVILGHDYPAVTEAVTRQMAGGTSFSLPHPLEVEVAEMLTEVIPCAEMVRFGKNGSDATAGAVRVARAYTGREVIACCGYHGWQDWYIASTTRNRGVPESCRELILPFSYNDLSSVERIFQAHPGRVAAVILEPAGAVEPRNGFLEGLRELTTREGSLLIFDEVITGFRLALGGAQEYFGVTPDLGCFGKAMANGYPLSAVVGKREIMSLFDEVFFSFTFGGEALSLAAAKATIGEMKRCNVIGHLWEQGQKLKDGFNILAEEFGVAARASCRGYAPRTVITFLDETGGESLLCKSLFQQECLKRGVLFMGFHNLCFSHADSDIDETLRVYRAAFEIFADAVRCGDAAARLEGKPLQPVFRKA